MQRQYPECFQKSKKFNKNLLGGKQVQLYRITFITTRLELKYKLAQFVEEKPLSIVKLTNNFIHSLVS